MALIPATSTTEGMIVMSLEADIGGGVAAGDGRDHQLGQADRQGTHGGRDQGCSAAAADADHTEDATGLMLAAQVAFECVAHRGDGLATTRSRKRSRVTFVGRMTDRRL